MIKILIADDHPALREGTANLIIQESDMQVIGQADDGAELCKLLQELLPDLILIDINMPVMNGLEAMREIKIKYPAIKIIVFTQYDEKRFVKRVIKSGANGYLLKNAARVEIVKAIRMVIEGGMYLSSGLPNVFSDSKSSKPKSDYFFAELTSRELEILNLICQGKTSHEIAEALFISFNTVESHRSNILLKVGVKNTAGLVKWALENEILN